MRVRLNRENEDKYIYTSTRYHYVKTKQVRRRSTWSRLTYMSNAIYLDTETSHTDSIAWIYQWAFEFNGQYIIGRTPKQLMRELHRIVKIYHLDDEKRVICYIHNASYDLQYMIDYLIEEFNEEPKILALDQHKILTAVVSGIEFRCSYLLSNMALAKWAEKLETKTRKMVGAVDYDTIHYQQDKLSITDWEYQINDVQTLKECVEAELIGSGDTLATIPLTSTGYVRRDIRNECRADSNYWHWFQKTRLDVESYRMCNLAFAGGYTHGNRFLAAVTIDKEVGHCDYKSHYPSREELDYAPITKFGLYYNEETDTGQMKREELDKLCEEYCVLIKITIKDVKLKPGVTAPMLSVSAALNTNFDFKADNGRVLSISGDIPAIYVFTELDYYWLKRQYDFKMIINEVYIADRGPFPEPIRKITNKYFEIKETLSDGYYYMKSKNKLNAIYGCSATNPVRSDISLDFSTGIWTTTRKDSDEAIREALDKFYASRNNVMPYQIGIYVTAHARDKLFHMIADVVGYENFIYCDTDSIFYIKKEEIEKKIAAENKKIIALNKKLGLGVKNKKGKISYYGTFEDEGDNIHRFRFLHSKCYAFENDTGLHCTIAGVTATNKLPETDPNFITREQELGSIDALVPGKVFEQCGGTRSIYYFSEPRTGYINGHLTEYASGCIIEKVEKTLNSTIEVIEIWEELAT